MLITLDKSYIQWAKSETVNDVYADSGFQQESPLTLRAKQLTNIYKEKVFSLLDHVMYAY